MTKEPLSPLEPPTNEPLHVMPPSEGCLGNIEPLESAGSRWARYLGLGALGCVGLVGLFRVPVLSVLLSSVALGLGIAAGVSLARGLRTAGDPDREGESVRGSAWCITILALPIAAALSVISMMVAMTMYGGKESPLPKGLFAFAGGQDAADLRDEAIQSMRSGDYSRAERCYRRLVSQQPGDIKLRANLAFVLTSANKHREAIAIYDALTREGEGTYDLFAYHARSLDALGRSDEAIVWNYRALALVPSLVDVRGDLARILVKQDRSYEALSLLASFDEQLESRGEQPYFQGKRMAIAATLPPPSEISPVGLKSTKLGGHYYSVALGQKGESIPFLIDTGATHTTMSKQVLELLGFTIPGNAKRVDMRTADGRTATGMQFVLPHLRLGPYSLTDVQVVVLDKCASLLGQTTLERFDLSTSRLEGLEVLTLKLRS